MQKKTLENNIKKNYKSVQNYLKGDPWAEWFLSSLADLQTDFADYLIEILKTKKYGKDDVKKSNIYQWHIKWWEYKYIDSERLEHIVSNKVLWKKVSINSLLDEWIKKLEELFDTQKSFEEALKSWKLQSVELNKVILPTEKDSPGPITWSDKWLENKNLSQNKFWLFISTLRELWIYDDDLIIYYGEVESNMMRKNTYYAIFIPRINKTVFLNTWYSEATFICEWEVPIDKMTTLWKEKLQSELWAIKIIFFENDIEWWKNRLSNVLLWEWWKVWKKVEVKKIRNWINRFVELSKLKDFYADHKNDTFIDSDWKESTVKKLFSSFVYYKKNYKKINEQFLHDVNFPGNPSSYYTITWNNFLIKLWINVDTREIISLADLNIFYNRYKNDDKATFIDSDWKESTIEKLFSNQKYYMDNYIKINDDPKKFDNVRLPWNPITYYGDQINHKWSDLLIELWVKIDKRKIISLADLKIFFEDKNNRDIVFYKNITIKTLFSSLDSYLKYYKEFNKNTNFGFRLPGDNVRYYNEHEKISKIDWKEFQKELWIEVDTRKIISLDDLIDFYDRYKYDSTIKELFSNGLDFYKNNYKTINNNPESFENIRLPWNPLNHYGNKLKRVITRHDFLWLIESGIDTRKIISLEDIKKLIINKSKVFVDENWEETEFFIDHEWKKSTVEKLFSWREYYKKNFERANKVFTLRVKFSADPKQRYKIWWKEIKAFLWT